MTVAIGLEVEAEAVVLVRIWGRGVDLLLFVGDFEVVTSGREFECRRGFVAGRTLEDWATANFE